MRTGEAERLASLRTQIRSVRDEIVGILARMDDITLQQLPSIRADYALKIGCWEQALIEAELSARRSRRRLDLAQAQVNQGEPPQMGAIEKQLDTEFAEWADKAEQAQIAYERALAYLTGMRPMSAAESKQLKALYRTLVKRLHPDVHGGSEEHTALFMLAQMAYRNGDPDALRSLEVVTRHMEAADDLESVDDPALLEQELELAQIEEGVMRERLRELEECVEMQLGHLLDDPEWVTSRTTELRRAIEEWERVRSDCDERLRKLKEASDGR